MGIYDRHYLRDPVPRPGGYGGIGLRSMRMWSANTWLIVICIAVYVIDGFTPWVNFNYGQPMLREGIKSLPSTAIMVDEVQSLDIPVRDSQGKVTSQKMLVKPILSSPQEKELIGWQEIMPMHALTAFLHFSSHELMSNVGFWRLIGFQFLHHDMGHLFFNMLGLFFFGPMVERYLGSKRYLAFYLLCGIFGAAMYGLLNVAGYAVHTLFGVDRIPGLLFYDMATRLVGASAGVYGVLMAGAFIAPNSKVLLFFILPVRLKHFAYAIVAIAFLTVMMHGDNAGGQAGHLGGAFAGFYFIRRPHSLHGFFDFLGRVDPTSHHYRTKGLEARGKAVAKSNRGQSAGGGKKHSREKVDRILDKINAKGMHSLTDKEKKILREASEGD